MHTVEVDLPEAKTASGNPVGTTTMQFEATHYLNNGFTDNHGGVFLQRVRGADPHKITFRSANSGGSITPNLGVDGLSRALGPVSGDIAELHHRQPHAEDGLRRRGRETARRAAAVGDPAASISFDDGRHQPGAVADVGRAEPASDRHPNWTGTRRSSRAGPAPGITVFVPTGDDPTNSMDLHALIITDRRATRRRRRSTVPGRSATSSCTCSAAARRTSS